MAHILLVEDDDILSELLADKLKAAGHRVTVVEDGGDAAARACTVMPDLIVLDCALPTMSGAGVIRALKEQLPDADIPVILMSARSSEAYIQDMLLEGATTYLVKPLNLRRFIETVDHQLTLRRERHERRAA